MELNLIVLPIFTRLFDWVESSQVIILKLKYALLAHISWWDISPNKHQLQCLSKFGLAAYGDVHWRDLGFGSDYEACNISFNFNGEQLHETHLPNFQYQLKNRKFQLTNLKGFLVVVSFQSDRHIKI